MLLPCACVILLKEGEHTWPAGASALHIHVPQVRGLRLLHVAASCLCYLAEGGGAHVAGRCVCTAHLCTALAPAVLASCDLAQGGMEYTRPARAAVVHIHVPQVWACVPCSCCLRISQGAWLCLCTPTRPAMATAVQVGRGAFSSVVCWRREAGAN